MIEIVEGDAADIASIMTIMDDAFDPAFGEAWTSAQCLSALAIPGCRLLIAKYSGEISGFSMSRWVLDTEELLMIGVARQWQRQKIGAQLLSKTISLAKSEGRSQIFLEVRDGNRAHDFYADVGFKAIGRRKNYYKGSDGFRPDAITMSFDL
jgi:[ribosomal protein S18]-alanine N-acetyltransferase